MMVCRQGQMELHVPYFYIETIYNFQYLITDDNCKAILIDSLKYLISKQFINLNAFVIMPNHIHFIWTMLKKNGNECPSASFARFTSHRFKVYLEKNPLNF